MAQPPDEKGRCTCFGDSGSMPALTRHTDGPWKKDDQHTGGAHAIIGDGTQLVALVYGKTADQQSANASVVSAGHDFMEAAALMTNAEQSGGDHWWRGFEMLKSAYKKAGGQFPSMDEINL